MSKYIFNRREVKDHGGKSAKPSNVFLVVSKRTPGGVFTNHAEFKKSDLTDETKEFLYEKLYEALIKRYPEIEPSVKVIQMPKK